MLSALIHSRLGYPAVHLAAQPVDRRSVRHGPLVPVAAPIKTPAPTIDRDRTVSRRSEPSSRATLMGEQPNPWDLLQPQDVTSRHRGAKPPRRYELLGDQPVIPGVPFILWATDLPYGSAGSLCPSFLPARDVSLPVKRPYAIALYKAGYQSAWGHLWKPPLRFWRRPPQSNYPPNNVPHKRVRPQTAKGPYFKDGSTWLAYMLRSLRPILHIGWPRSMLSYSKGSRGLFVPSRVIGIFTDTTISLSSWLRQRPIITPFVQVGTYPTRNFCYLRTVIVTAAVYWGFNSMLLLIEWHLLLTFRHRAGGLYTSSFRFSTALCFC